MVDRHVIVGAGQAGAWIARTLRAEGFAGEILLIGAEAHHPYERPPLSKGVLAGEEGANVIALSPEEAKAQDIRCLLGEEVTAIDRSARTVRCASGAIHQYFRLFLTMGSRPRLFPAAAELVESSRVHVLRTQDDAERLRAALLKGASLAVLGGGWIGLEVAATARKMGCAVTVIEVAPRLCSRSVPAEVSAWLVRLHEAEGVQIRLGAEVISVVVEDDGVAVSLRGNGRITTDHLLVGIGIVPNDRLATESGLATDDGIIVDAAGRTSDPDIFAAGDVTRQPCRWTGMHVRRESWANAQNQAIAAARAALGHDVHYQDVPWLWSDQYEHNIQIIGSPERGGACLARGWSDGRRGSWLMLDDDGRPAGAISVNAPADLRVVRKAIETEAMIDPEKWTDAAIPAKDCLKKR